MTVDAAEAIDRPEEPVETGRPDLDVRWTAPLVAVFVLVRVLTVAGRPPVLENDAPSYLELDWWRGVRLPTVPIVFWLAGRDHEVIIWVQMVLATTMWGLSAVALSRLIDDRRVARAVLAAVLFLGATRPVAGWDVAIQSESIAIGLWISLVALTLHLVVRPSRRLVAAWIVIAVLWLFSRQAHAYMLLMIAPAFVLLAWRRRDERRTWAGLVVVVVVLAAVGVADGSNPVLSRSSLIRIMCDRMFGNESRMQWFRDEGMPEPPREALAPTRQPCFRVLEADPTFRRWMEGPGYPTYSSFIVAHPTYPAATFTERGTVIGVLSGPDVGARQVIPKAIEGFVWPRQPAGGAALGGVLGLALAAAMVVALRSRRLSMVERVCLYALALVPPMMVIVWVGLPPPIQRPLVLAALQLRLATLLIVAAALVGVIARPSTEAVDPDA